MRVKEKQRKRKKKKQKQKRERRKRQSNKYNGQTLYTRLLFEYAEVSGIFSKITIKGKLFC